MPTERKLSYEEEVIKEEWLGKLADFIVIANKKTWASDGSEVEPRRPGYKRLQWPYPNNKMAVQDKRDYEGWKDWRLEDEYTGYFRAPGTTTIYYKGQPAWIMQYGGHGQTEGYEDGVKQTFEFLKHALMRVSSDLPIRGQKIYSEGDKIYSFEMLEGDMTDGLWREQIVENEALTFTQTGAVGIVINRDTNRQPQLPWNL